MPQFIDRRLNPRDKSLGNRMRFLKRTRARIKEAVDKAVRERTIGDAAKGGSVSIPSDGINEPMFHDSDSGGDRNRVMPGNKEFVSGDRIDKPKGGQGGRGRKGANDGDGEDNFTVRTLIERHAVETDSAVAARILDRWELEQREFVKVVPRDYRRIMEASRLAEAEGRPVDEAIMEAAARG